ncbi:MAG: fibronectin type III domain-containing protein [Fibrobacteria bacterium]
MRYRMLFSAFAFSLPMLVLTRNPALAKPDVVSAASLTVAVGAVTATTAVINYSRDKYDYGTRTLCYAVSPAAATTNCTTKTASGNQGSFTISGLKAATKYNFKIEAVDTKGGERPYNTTGTFTTATPTGIRAPQVRLTPGLAGSDRVDVRGRAIQAAVPATQRVLPLPAR